MFDVSWNDPMCETVGQRKSRKDQEASTLSREQSSRSSRSSDSSTLKASSLFGLFANKKSLRRGPSRAKRALGGDDNASRRVSTYMGTSSSSSSDAPGPPNKEPDGTSGTHDPQGGRPSNESVFSGSTGKSTATESSWGSVVEGTKGGPIVQTLSPKSYVTQSTEVTISPTGTIPIRLPSEASGKGDTETSTFDFPMPSFNKAGMTSPTRNKELSDVAASEAAKPRRRQSDIWRPPSEWECPEDVKPQQPACQYPRPGRKHVTPSTELTHLHKNIRIMEAASAKIMLERLTEEWLEVADASVYKDLETEKQLWLLSVLRHFYGFAPKIQSPGDGAGVHAPPKLLSLYENPACASFLSALSPSSRTQIHHLSPKPLSPRSFPNVHPLAVPSATPMLPYAERNFDSIHAFSMPSLMASASLPALLKECHRCLASASSGLPSQQGKEIKPGVLHLTIIDPSPVAETVGPRFRAWLDTHLLINLEKSFRCVTPARLFPGWLEDAKLRAVGSTIQRTQFYAAGINKRQDEREQLRTCAGRMLWKEMWGTYVRSEGVAQRWWWDEPAIMEECVRLDTVWEFCMIEAVRED